MDNALHISRPQKLGWAAGALIVIVSHLPLSASDHWAVRMWDFPRLQIVVLRLFTLTYLLRFTKKLRSREGCALAILGFACYSQAACIWPYTTWHSPQTESSRITNSDQNVRVLTANVLQENQDPESLLMLIDEKTPESLDFSRGYRQYLR